MYTLSALPSYSQPVLTGFTPSLSRNFIAKSALTALVLSSLPTLVESGPFTYAACVSGCEMAFTQAGLAGTVTTANPLLIPILSLAGWVGCPVACGPILTAPSP